MKSVTYFLDRGWSLDTSEVTKLWLFDESGDELLQGPFVEGVDFRLTRDGERRPSGVGFPIGAKCVGRDSVGRLLWLVKERRAWYLKCALQEVDDLDDENGDGMVDLEYAVPVRVLDEELWKDIPGFPNHQAHPEGEIRVKKTKKLLRCESRNKEYRETQLDKQSVKVHRIIAETFIPNPERLPQVNHINGDKRANNCDNLEWVSSLENMTHALSTGLRVNKGPPKPVKVTMRSGKIINYPSMKDAAFALGVTESTVQHLMAKTGVYFGENYRKKEKEWIWKIERCKIAKDDVEERDVEMEGYEYLIARADGVILTKKHRTAIGSVQGNYVMVGSMSINGKRTMTTAHRIIATTFLPNPENKPYIIHKNGDRLLNCVSNLQWCSSKESAAHSKQIGSRNEETKKRAAVKLQVPVYQLELDGQIIRRFESLKHVKTSLEYDPYAVCAGYTKTKPQNLSGLGYGWCYVSDYREPLANRALSGLFPELVGRKNIDFDILRPYIVRSSRPVWQMDIGGNKLKLWQSVTDTENDLSGIINLRKAITSNLKIVAEGHFWIYATYEEIVNPKKPTPVKIPELIRKILGIPDIEGITLKKSVIKLLAENTPETSNAFRINKRPFYQLTLDEEIIKAWSGPTRMSIELGYVMNPILHVLKTGLHRTSHGYKWRYFKLQELCNNVPEEYWE